MGKTHVTTWVATCWKRAGFSTAHMGGNVGAAPPLN